MTFKFFRKNNSVKKITIYVYNKLQYIIKFKKNHF